MPGQRAGSRIPYPGHAVGFRAGELAVPAGMAVAMGRRRLPGDAALPRLFADPLDPSARLDACGRDHGELACDAPPPADGTGACSEAAEQAVFRAVFPDDATRRGLLARFGAAAVAGALASAFPLGHA